MIRVGGISYHNGIKFSSENYTSKFIYENGVVNLFLHKNTIKYSNKLHSFFKNIPFIRGFFSLYENNKFLFILMIITTVLQLRELSQTNSTDTVSTLNPIISTIILILAFGILLVVFFIFFKKPYHTTQYHGAEHKVIFTYQEQKELTFENCKAAPRINNNCGTMLVSFWLISYIILKTVTTIFNFKIVSMLSFLICWSIAYELFCLDSNLPIIRWIANIGFWVQKNILTKEPTDLQLTQAIEAFKLLENAETEQIPENELLDLLKNGKKIILESKAL